MAVVLAERDGGLPARARRVRAVIAEKLEVDPQLHGSRRAEVRLERLPCGEDAAQALIHSVRRG